MDFASFIDQAGERAHEAISTVAIGERRWVRAFAAMGSDGYALGWHERNGGNASLRLTPEEVQSVSGCMAAALGRPWIPLGVEEPAMAGECLLVTAAGSAMNRVAKEPSRLMGLVQLDEAGAAWRPLWGFEDGGRPTSELASHVVIHGARKEATDGRCRVVYHCHPVSIAALGSVLPACGPLVTNILWKMMTEAVMVFPEGLGFVGCEVPGSLDLARATAEEARTHQAILWSRHGLLATGADCEDAFGLAHVVVKAADIYRDACAMAGGPRLPHLMGDDELRRLAEGLGVSLNEACLDLA